MARFLLIGDEPLGIAVAQGLGTRSMSKTRGTRPRFVDLYNERRLLQPANRRRI